jgi:hypothetical protein
VNEITADRFWSKVDKSGDCWEWQGAINSEGYGNIGTNRKTYLAHRVSLLLDGQDPTGQQVRHQCHNRRCVRPNHLLLGTYRQNVDDGVRDRRYAYGERHGHAKLTWAQVQEIRESDEPLSTLAQRFGVTPSTVFSVRSGRRWKEN